MKRDVWGPRLVAGTPRSKSQKPNLFKNQRMVGIVNKIWGMAAEGYREKKHKLRVG